MKCDDARAAMIDELAGEPTAIESQPLHAHLQTCAACRAVRAQLTDVWDGLGAMAAGPLPAQDAAIMRQRLQDAVSSTGPTTRGRGWAWSQRHPRLVATAALLTAALVGAAAARSELAWRLFPPPNPQTVAARSALTSPDPNAGLYLFLLHRPDQANVPGRAMRYQQWADDLRDLGLLVRADALHSSWGWMLTRAGTAMTATPIPSPVGDVEGFFLIAASDSIDVLTAARLSPHFDYGGRIEVRRLTR